ncbi:MAG: hypothetical protein ACK5HT_12580 [Draconibacterium sp.]
MRGEMISTKALLLLVVLVFVILSASAQAELSRADSLWVENSKTELKQLIDMKNENLSEQNGEGIEQSRSVVAENKDSVTDETQKQVEKEKAARAIERLHKKESKRNSRRSWKEIGEFFKSWFGL